MSGLGWVAGIVAGALMVVGCSAEDADTDAAAAPPRTSEVATASPQPTASATPSPPRLPQAARHGGKAGAVAFAHHYIDLINYVRTGGDTQALREQSSPSCASCASLAEVAEGVYSGGGYLHGGSWSVSAASAVPSGKRAWQVVMKIMVSRQAYRPSAKSRVEHRRAEQANLVLRIERTGPEWRMSSLERQTDG